MPTRKAGTIPFILVTVLLDSLGVGLIIPVGPRLVASFLHDDLAAASHWFGLLVALFALMQFLFATIVGGLSDRFGRRPVILVSLFGAACSYLLSALAPTLSWLFIGRIITGITGASFSAANAYVADITPPEKRAASFGLVGAAFGFGFILGPALGGTLGDFGLRVPYFVAAGLNLVNFVYGLVVLPESLAEKDRRDFSFARSNPFGALRHLSKYPIVIALTGTIFCGFMAQWILQSVWALDMQARFGWKLREVGISLMIVGVAMAFVQGFGVRAVLPKLGQRGALLIGLFISVIGNAALGAATRGWMIYAILFPIALGGIAGPATQAIITHEVGPAEQGELQGSVNSVGGLAAIIGPLVGTALLGRFGPPDAHPHVPGAPFYAGAMIQLVGLALATRAFNRTVQPPSH